MKLSAIYRFYRDGFSAMRLGRTLWTVVAVKLLILFGVIKLLFFNDTLQSRFDSDEARQEYVSRQLTGTP
ncbi:DUF4492 domain-containing protein [Sulfurimonas sp. HSL-3221]|uniref:DUF4492 domain-containing protein n=1 Tax=Sulfurimonadaceae TaxID=2771471 RepID=UPI001E5AB915|nr:DUF4492 domain-containing protein [Sulfurimonas sp. HSL-3221]UFS62850.1 DUF4492 domain-containing protein [Sulfurimonas sp. HSL-3221]